METKKFHVKELSLTEAREVNGGIPSWPSWLKKGLLGTAIFLIIDNWEEIKSGIVDGWTDGINGD